MDIQNILTTAIEIVFMGFVSLMVYDFIDGLWVVPLLPTPQTLDAKFTTHAMTLATPKPEVIIATPSISTTPQPAIIIPDPWLTTDIQPQNQPQPVVLQFPTLRLLPPAEVQLKSKNRTTKSTKTNKTPKTIKQTKPVVVTESPRKSRKKAVA